MAPVFHVKQEDSVRDFCDYEGSGYRTDFWEGKGREYEDLAERIALRRLLPRRGRRLVEIGAGFGRLADLYRGHEQVILLDPAVSMLRQARESLGDEGHFQYVAASIYALPFADGALDTVVTVRVLHHLRRVPAALAEIRRITHPQGSYVLEYANKRHIKAILRYLARRQSWNPFSQEPVEFAELNFDFHPAWMEARLREAGFAIERRLAVSHFRLAVLKRLLGARLLAALDCWLQRPLAFLRLSPSLFLRARPHQRRGDLGP